MWRCILKNTIESSIKDVQEDILIDLYETINNDFSFIEKNLIELPKIKRPQDCLLNILPIVNKIREAVKQTYIQPYIDYIDAIENIIERIQNGRLPISENLSELLLLTTDYIQTICEDLLQERYFKYEEIQHLTKHLQLLAAISPSNSSSMVYECMKLLSTKVYPNDIPAEDNQIKYLTLDDVDNAISVHQSTLSPFVIRHDILHFSQENYSVELGLNKMKASDEQRRALNWFKDLAEQVEMRSRLWKNRTKKILFGCMLLNRNLPKDLQVDELQLRAAVYVHDMYMSLLPDSILFKKGKFDPVDIMLLQQHPIQAYEMLGLMPGWEGAAKMVHQHHERFDGKGYPLGIAGEGIHLGAQIIALADAFYSMTHERSDRKHYKSVMRATAALNKGQGSQFNPLIIAALNRATVTLWQQNAEKLSEAVAETA